MLGVTAAIDLAGETAARGNRRIDRVLSTGRPVPENIAFAAADRTNETGLDLSATTEIEPYPGGVAGVLVADGRLYTAVNGAAGCVRVRAWMRRGVDGAGDAPYRRKRVRQRNDLYADGDRLLVTESFGGTVYEVPLDCGDPTAWVQNALLNTENFGTNGMRERSGPFLATGALTVRLVSNEDIFLFKMIADRDDGIEEMNMLVQAGLDYDVVRSELEAQIDRLGDDQFATSASEALVNLDEQYGVTTPIEDRVQELTTRYYRGPDECPIRCVGIYCGRRAVEMVGETELAFCLRGRDRRATEATLTASLRRVVRGIPSWSSQRAAAGARRHHIR